MFKRLIVSILFLFSIGVLSQDYSTQWQGHFSFSKIVGLSQANNKIYAAAENAVFSIDTKTNELREFTTVNGLSGESISAIYYSPDFELLVVGYENGIIEIVFENDIKVLTVRDIFDKPTIPSNNKRINHFTGYQNLVYIATDFGISVFDLERLEFGDTYFIGANGSQIPVTQTTIINEFIYASSLNNNGIKKADLSDPNLIDFNNWQTINSGSWLGVQGVENNLYAINSNKKIYQILNDNVIELFTYSDSPQDLRQSDNNLIVSTTNHIFVYDADFNLISQIEQAQEFETSYTSAVVNENFVFIGTKNFGILKTIINSPFTFEEIHPDGPILNNPFSIEPTNEGVWVTFGEYDSEYNPYPLNSRGISQLKNDEWINTPYEDLFEAKCLNSIAINPANTNQVYISSFINGIVEIEENIPKILYNETNSGLESLVLPSNPNYVDIRVGTSTFDKNGLLWSLTSRIDRPLKSYNPANGQWRSFDFTSLINSGLDDNLGFSKIVIGSDGTIWCASSNFGLIGFHENNGSQLLKNIAREEHNMPSNQVTGMALDKRNQLWIGTLRGLRVLYNPSDFFDSTDIRVDEIIIEEDGIAKELLYQQNITDIEVDGSNNKWIGTSDSGLFYFSPDGQRTIFHFTRTNSPLPSNSIRDISIDGDNGIVYIATQKGLVSFKSGSSQPIKDLQQAFAYPNPVRPHFDIVEKKVKIKDVSEHVNIKITDIEGNLVAEAQSRINQRYGGYNLEIDGGTAYWNGKNLANNMVSSGVYLIMISDLDTFETKVIKLMVVR
ncbi:ABC transporter substrate-binding protein [Tamlana fucoidanivorans]|uniref:ABC transporter substrate-binding protein n=1 Tax=Allotamlana fucoidanivorans TaxID=2583814 RepID=A0A5C4STQ1_9FLAO|nr:two-component regulator propeller domain-containing protein [Tamlana fucoidanivorans]TNJ46991.1 ABC transporter substrate-binding protein [Tamlana fucoidanivorans]